MTLYVKPYSALLTRDTEMFSNMDPFVLVQVGGEKKRTKTHQEGGKKPRWDQILVFKTKQNKITIKVMDQDSTSNDIIGSADVFLDKYMNEGAQFKEVLTLNHSGKCAGKMQVSIKYLSDTPHENNNHNLSWGHGSQANNNNNNNQFQNNNNQFQSQPFQNNHQYSGWGPMPNNSEWNNHNPSQNYGFNNNNNNNNQFGNNNNNFGNNNNPDLLAQEFANQNAFNNQNNNNGLNQNNNNGFNQNNNNGGWNQNQQGFNNNNGGWNQNYNNNWNKTNAVNSEFDDQNKNEEDQGEADQNNG